MSRAYAESRIRAALEEAEGNLMQAKRLVVAWAHEDHKLLQGLTEPHLQGIVAHAIGHVAKLDGTKVSDETPSDEEGELDIATAIAGGGEKFGTAGQHRKPTKASQRHVDAIHQIAKKVKKTD